jgi:hypothetical protein
MANKKTKPSNKPVVAMIDLLYMTPDEVSSKEIAELFQEDSGITIELWSEMNVLELVLKSNNSVDFEPLEASFKDPSDASFIKNRNIHTIFAITLCESDLESVIPYFERIVQTYSGFICADSADFNPVYAGSSKR